MRQVTQNRYAAALTGMSGSQALGFDHTTQRAVIHQHGAVVERHRWPLERAFSGDDVDGEEYVLVQPGQDPTTLLVNARGLRGQDGITGAIAVALDISERKRADEQRRLLLNELNHRVKNTLATIQSLATQSLREHAVDRHVARTLTDRIMALSKAHDLLTRESWEGASLGDLVRQMVALYGPESALRFIVSGPCVRVVPRVALGMALTLHELATNATKYGALSNGTGTVEIVWTLEARANATEQLLTLCWTERGGPRVEEPSRTGFGTRLLQRSMAAEPEGSVAMVFHPQGLVCTARLLIDASLTGAMTKEGS
jgi:two-component sensor histidine kinase